MGDINVAGSCGICDKSIHNCVFALFLYKTTKPYIQTARDKEPQADLTALWIVLALLILTIIGMIYYFI